MSDQVMASTTQATTATSRHWLRVVPIGLAAGFVAGLVTAVPARMLMRLVALAAGHETHFSWVNSIGIAVVFGLAMIPGALLAAATRRHQRWLLFAGALLLFVPATGVASEELSDTASFTLANWVGVVLAGAGVYGCIVAMPFFTALLVRRWSR